MPFLLVAQRFGYRRLPTCANASLNSRAHLGRTIPIVAAIRLGQRAEDVPVFGRVRQGWSATGTLLARRRPVPQHPALRTNVPARGGCVRLRRLSPAQRTARARHSWGTRTTSLPSSVGGHLASRRRGRPRLERIDPPNPDQPPQRCPGPTALLRPADTVGPVAGDHEIQHPCHHDSRSSWRIDAPMGAGFVNVRAVLAR